MASDIPFGASFGDPRKYMGQSGIGQAVKAGLTAAVMQKSGLTGWLNDLSKKPEGSVPPITSGAAGDMNTNGVWGTNPLPVQPPSFGASSEIAPIAPSAIPPAAMGAQPAMPTADMGPPLDVGHQVLDDKWESSSAEPIQKQDFNPLAPDTGNQMAISGNDYQKVPGYGSLKKTLAAIAGME